MSWWAVRTVAAAPLLSVMVVLSASVPVPATTDISDLSAYTLRSGLLRISLNPELEFQSELTCAAGTVMSTALFASGVNADPFTLTDWIAESALVPCAEVAKSLALLPESVRFPLESRPAKLPFVAPLTLSALPLMSWWDCKAVSALASDACTPELRSVSGMPPDGF